MRNLILFLAILSTTTTALGSDPFDGAWSQEKVDEILDTTLRLHLDSDLSQLSPAERLALDKLFRVGELFHSIYLEQRHPESLPARASLRSLKLAVTEADRARDLLDLFRLMKGPIATDLDNQRTPFLGVREETPGKNVYPVGIEQSTLDAYFDSNPNERAGLLHLRSVVRESTEAHLARDLQTLDANPVLDALHPGLRERLQSEPGGYYALPYSVAFADRILEAFELLNAAADVIEDEDIDFARYLRLRARDLLADNYDGSDAQWITGRFSGVLNAQLGSYETYDDALYGVKSFFSASILLRDETRSQELMRALGDIQAIENALPYEAHKTVRSDIPVGVYNVLADFGQARGTNTASILPNEGHLSRQYGRTILIRANILTNPQLFALAEERFNAAVADAHHGELKPEGAFNRTLWHEVGHYLGVDRTKDGRELDVALRDTADLLEEMKADLVSLFSAQKLGDAGHHDEALVHAIYASGIRRVLQSRQPRRSQAYQTMQLIQWNWYMDRGLLEFKDDKLQIHYEQYPEAVASLLEQVLDLQHEGDRGAAQAFVEQWTSWDEELHGVIAANIRDAQRYRYRLVTYGALGEQASEPGR